MFNFKKFVALGMVASMAVGCSVTSFAASGDPAEQTEPTAAEITGAGTDIYVNKEVYKAKLPTAGAVAALAYTVDVQGLIAETAAEGVTVEEGAGILFANSATEYSSTSNPVTVTNMSSIPISLAVAVKLTPSTDEAKYAGGYATASDFKSDTTNGIYLGVQGTTEDKLQALSETSATINTVMPTAAQYYETKVTDGVYSYALPSDVSAIEFPTYDMTVYGAVNPDVAETAFATVAADTGVVTTKKMPTISLTFTPAAIKGFKNAVVSVEDNGNSFYVSKASATGADGGFGTNKPTAASINGKTITVGSLGSNVDGFIKFTWDDFYKAYGYTKEDDIPDIDALYGMLNSLKFTVDGVEYYVELK